MRLSARLLTFMVIISPHFFATADEASAPVIELPPGNMTAIVGEGVILECTAAGVPAPTISWLYQGQPLVNDTGRFEVLETGGLLINDLKESDTGIYSCQAANNAGHAIATADLVVVGKSQAPDIQFSDGSIRAGVGYSSDKQQIVAQACYNVESTSSSQQQATVKLDSSMSYGELASEIGVSVSVKGSYGMFSADASANYMRSMEDKDYSTSLNYYAKYTTQTTVQLAGSGKDALTAVGKSFYNNNKKYFGLVCGDEYVSSYEQGVFLAMGINIMFSSSESKQKFDAKVGASYGDMASATLNISGFINENKIRGSVIIQAFQIGGEPSQISKILSHDDSKYFALMCSLTEMENCIKASSGLLDYARNELPKQFSFGKNEGLTPIGLGTTQYNPTYEIGLDMPPSVVTPEIERIRNEFAEKLQENQYYKQKLHPFMAGGYPVVLEEGFARKVHDLFRKVEMNVATLMQPHRGAADCFNEPVQCKELKRIIDSKLTTITKDDLSLLENIKYCGTFLTFSYIPDGSRALWYESLFDQMKIKLNAYPFGLQIKEFIDISEDNNKFKFSFTIPIPQPYHFETTSTQTHGSEVTYDGLLTRPFDGESVPFKITKKISPFYFEAYKSSP